MTKYVLVGGYPYKAADGGKAFYEELVADFAEPSKVLICEFARSEDWQELFAGDVKLMKERLPGQQLEFKLASVLGLAEEIKWADVIYLKGGSTQKLKEAFTQGQNVDVETWRKLLEGKTLGGTSAGVNVMSEYYYALSHGVIEQGLGLLHIKVLVHYQSDYPGPGFDWGKARQKLKSAAGDALPIFALREGEIKVIKR